MKKNIGIAAAWDLRGGGHCGRLLAKSLLSHHHVHVYAHYLFDREDSLPVASFTYFRKQDFDFLHFTQWLKTAAIDIVFFHEKLQYGDDVNARAILDHCRSQGIVTVLILMQELIYPQHIEHYQRFSTIFCPVQCTYDILESYGVKTKFFLRWGIDESLFQVLPSAQTRKASLTFLFNSGLGGGSTWRKNPAAVVKAFHRASKRCPGIRLIFKSQRPLRDYSRTVRIIIKKNKQIILITKNYTEKQMLQLYAETDVSLLPSKWEGIGLPFLEALAAGHPILTVNCAPMNEWVTDGVNGYCATVARWNEPYKVLVDSRDLADKMQILSETPSLVKSMGEQSRLMVNQSFFRFRDGLLSVINKLEPGR